MATIKIWDLTPTVLRYLVPRTVTSVKCELTGGDSTIVSILFKNIILKIWAVTLKDSYTSSQRYMFLVIL
ncbi:hypothetical protein Glove_261g77 [Diversispora epigaea]|uniref:Uncharacterized protein n=1 Tax=Diversispora epigaea TaxID=1348612 RepID=A0A397I675_9GLOM|nr:hypothetical protein Glove_261g77 [Diversispora epigaea]